VAAMDRADVGRCESEGPPMTTTHNVYVDVPPGNDMAAAGQEIIRAIRDAERVGGADWRKGGAVVKREPLTYEKHSTRSWFLDRARADILQDDTARARLRRHSEEMDVEQRTNPNTVAGTGGELAVPLWLVPFFSPAVAGGRIVADLIDRVGNLFPLPPGVSSINVPRIVAGASSISQGTQGSAEASIDPTTGKAAGAGQIVTIAGDVIVSQQLLDLTPAPGADQVFLTELNSNYNHNLELQCLNGTSANGQLLGLGNVTGVSTRDGTTATTIALVWPLIGNLLATVGNKRLEPATHFIMAPRRWAWIVSSIDNQNRPIGTPGDDVPQMSQYPQAGGDWVNQQYPVGRLDGLPVWQSGAILPQGVQPNANADIIYAIRPKDLFMWESGPKVLVTPEPTSGTLQVRIRLAHYVAAVFDRYPTGIGTLTACPAPSGY
jgi:hypothetical protein